MFRRTLVSSSKIRVEHYIKCSKAALTQSRNNYFTRETMLQHQYLIFIQRAPPVIFLFFWGREAVGWLTVFLFYIEKGTLLLVGRKTRWV